MLHGTQLARVVGGDAGNPGTSSGAIRLLRHRSIAPFRDPASGHRVRTPCRMDMARQTRIVGGIESRRNL
jgi:hypothetical protein